MSTASIPFGFPMIGDEERAAVLDVLSGPVLVHGPRSARFEADFAAWTGAPHAVSVSSCTAGMHLLYVALGLGPGDEVLVPAQTHVATAHAVELTGARAVFVDSDPVTGNIDLNALEAAVTGRTRAIAVVHYLGLPVDMTVVTALARRRGLFVLEDCALAVGTRLDGVHAGLHGDAGVFSFYPVKHMTTAEGGMVVTRDGALAAQLKLLRAFGVDRAPAERAMPGMYDVVALGFNYRMSELAAAIGIEQVRKLDRFLERRAINARALAAALDGINGLALLGLGDGGRFASAHYCLSALLPEALAPRRDGIVQRLRAAGIGTSVYYPRPVPAMAWYRDRYGLRAADFPVAARISDASIALPVGPHLDEADMARIGAAFRDAIAGEPS